MEQSTEEFVSSQSAWLLERVASLNHSDSEVAQFNHALQVLASTLQRVQEGNLTPEGFADQAFAIAPFAGERVPYAGASYVTRASEQRGAR